MPVLCICNARIWWRAASSSHLVMAPGNVPSFAGLDKIHFSALMYAFLSSRAMSCLDHSIRKLFEVWIGFRNANHDRRFVGVVHAARLSTDAGAVLARPVNATRRRMSLNFHMFRISFQLFSNHKAHKILLFFLLGINPFYMYQM